MINAWWLLPAVWGGVFVGYFVASMAKAGKDDKRE